MSLFSGTKFCSGMDIAVPCWSLNIQVIQKDMVRQ